MSSSTLIDLFPEHKILLKIALNDLESKCLASEMLNEKTIPSNHVTTLKEVLREWLYE